MPVLGDQVQRVLVRRRRQVHVGEPLGVRRTHGAGVEAEVELGLSAVDDTLQGGQQRLVGAVEFAGIAVVQMLGATEGRQQPGGTAGRR
jgi:hypothetical protein